MVGGVLMELSIFSFFHFSMTGKMMRYIKTPHSAQWNHVKAADVRDPLQTWIISALFHWKQPEEAPDKQCNV